MKARKTFTIFVVALFALFGSVVYSQNLDRIERGRAKDMLNAVKREIKDKYYDPAYRGIDIDARFKAAEQKLEAATTLGQAFGIIAQAVLDLNDSHTTFYPPARAGNVEYGWRWRMVGDRCFVTAVRPKSDAEAKGLKVGDEILAIEKFRPVRKEMWKVSYYYNTLSPRTGLNLIVKSPGDADPRELNVASKVTPLKARMSFEDLVREIELAGAHRIEHRFVRVGNTTVWQMPTFSVEPSSVEAIMKGRAGQAGNLILDLRGNGGGYVVTLEALAGFFVDKDTKIADLKGRKEMKPQMAKTRGNDVYKGKLIVLLDSNSGSASEIFARFIQLQERGIVLGDQSAGAVMQSRSEPMSMGVDSIVPYGVSITNADVIMSDGASLEHVGVTPNERILPTGADLSQGHDPVLARAFAILGENVTAEQAGKYFPFDWDKVD